jgi:sentrin-specific protease 1
MQTSGSYLPSNYDYEAVMHTTRILRHKFLDIFKLSTLIVPINVKRRHWFFAAIFPQEHSIAIIDSRPGDHDIYYRVLLRYLNDEHVARHGVGLLGCWARVRIDCPMQDNNDDCGVFTLLGIDFLLLGEPLEFTQRDIPFARRYILWRLIEGSVLAFS